MTTTEHIIETYYRLTKHCLTMTDYKVVNGNNRQLDVLAFEPIGKKFYHIEVSVTHHEHWTADLKKVKEDIGYKFFGLPRNNRPDNPNTDFNKGKTYEEQIKQSYKNFGMNWKDVVRVWCLWRFNETESEIEEWKLDLQETYGINADRFELLSFRDKVIPELFNNISQSNYSDEILRTISLIKEYENQTQR